MINVHFKKKTYVTPGRWNELSARQLVGVVNVLQSNVEEIRGRLKIFKLITGMSWWTFFHVKTEDMARVITLTDFLLKENRLTRQLFPKIKGLYGAQSELANLKMKEFVFSELYFARYAQTKEENDLNHLIAVLYRPAKARYDRRKDKDGDLREEFNANLTGRLARKIDKWPLRLKWAVMVWYAGCREHWTRTYPEVFKNTGGESGKYGMYSIIRGVAKDGVFGKFENVEEQYVNTVMMHLTETIIEARALEKMYKK